MKKSSYFAERLPPEWKGQEFKWSFDEKSQRFSYTCPQGHEREISCSQAVNRLGICRRSNTSLTPEDPGYQWFCADCNRGSRRGTTAKKWETRCVELGFQFISHDPPSRKVKYICSCGAEKEVTEAALLNPNHQGGCRQCSQLQNRNSLADLKVEFVEGGCELLSTEYTNNKDPLKYKCSCGETALILLSDFRRGKRCQNCAGERATQTNLQIYGVANPAQSEEVKEKGRQTCLRVYGKPHHSQNPQVQARKEATCLQNHGVKTILMKPEIREKARQAMIDKHGYAYGFQVPAVMEKIRVQNQEKYQTDYPFQSPKFWEEYKRKYQELYNVSFHTQLREWKLKTIPVAIQNNVSQKPYKFPSGKIETVLGYEGYCLDILLGKTKSPKYKGEILSEDCISICPAPIDYVDEKGVERIYFPDLEIRGGQGVVKIIEVKSMFTFNVTPKKNYLKGQAASQIQAFEIWILQKDRLLEIITFKDRKAFFSSGKEYQGGKLALPSGSTEGVPSGSTEGVPESNPEDIFQQQFEETLHATLEDV